MHSHLLWWCPSAKHFKIYVHAFGPQIGQYLQRKLAAAVTAASSARARSCADVQHEFEDDGVGDRLIQDLAQPQVPPRNCALPVAGDRPHYSHHPKIVTISTGAEQVDLQITGTERPDALDGNLNDLLGQHTKMHPGQVGPSHLLSLRFQPFGKKRGQNPVLLRPCRRCCCGFRAFISPMPKVIRSCCLLQYLTAPPFRSQSFRSHVLHHRCLHQL